MTKNRKILLVVLGAMLLLALVAILWWWFLGQETPTPERSETFGTAETKTPSGGSVTNPLVNQPVGSPSTPGGTAGAGGAVRGGAGGGVSSTQEGAIPSATGTAGTFGQTGVPGVTFFGGGAFSPTPINPVGSANPVPPPPSLSGGGGGSSGPGFGSQFAVCTSFLAQALVGTLSPTSLFAVQVNAPAENSKHFMDCIARVLARIALQQMTTSIVNWVNSGFGGKSAFVQNYQQFFTSIADKAAGEFIRGSSLSFLCSPFQGQVRTAVAQSYARRSAAPASCTLSGIAAGGSGSFFGRGSSAGGWPSFLSFTTNPANNPFLGYMYGQTALQSSISQAQSEQALDLNLGRGFLSTRDPISGDITTPGSVVQPVVVNALGTNYRQLELAKTFDETLSVLITQLINQTLYGGFSNLSRGGGYGANQTPLLAAAQELLTALQAAVGAAQQYGQTKQGSIADIQNTQSQLNTLANCWEGVASSTGNFQAQSDAQNTRALIATLEARITTFNRDITRANAAITILEQLQTRTLASKTKAEVDSIATDFAAAQAQGSLIMPAEVTTAGQDRAALQSEMNEVNQNTSTKLQQCYAFGI